jgi:hypothetical protein
VEIEVWHTKLGSKSSNAHRKSVDTSLGPEPTASIHETDVDHPATKAPRRRFTERSILRKATKLPKSKSPPSITAKTPETGEATPSAETPKEKSTHKRKTTTLLLPIPMKVSRRRELSKRANTALRTTKKTPVYMELPSDAEKAELGKLEDGDEGRPRK